MWLGLPLRRELSARKRSSLTARRWLLESGCNVCQLPFTRFLEQTTSIVDADNQIGCVQAYSPFGKEWNLLLLIHHRVGSSRVRQRPNKHHPSSKDERVIPVASKVPYAQAQADSLSDCENDAGGD